MSKEILSKTEKLAEFSKRIDYVVIAIGMGIYILFKKSIGLVLIIGSVLTLIPAAFIGNWAKRKRLSAQAA